MARDYAKKTSSRSVKNPERADPLAKLWYVAAAIIVFVVLGLLYLKREHLETELTAPTVIKKKPVRPIQTSQATVQETTKPRFEFYTMLPNDSTGMERRILEAPESPAKMPAPKLPPADKAELVPKLPKEIKPIALPRAVNPLPRTTAKASELPKETKSNFAPREVRATAKSGRGRYWVQVAAFHRFSEADQVKAALSRQGIASVLQSSQDHGVTWIRVQVGPFETAAEAREARERLARKKFAGVIRQGA